MFPYYLGYVSPTFNSYQKSRADRSVGERVRPLALPSDIEFVKYQSGGALTLK